MKMRNMKRNTMTRKKEYNMKVERQESGTTERNKQRI